MFVDESGFYLLPSVVKTYAPIGQTPVLSVPLTRDHLSAISGITEDGKLLIQVKDHSIKGVDCVEFLKHLLHHIPGKLIVIWDGSTIHRCQPVKDFLKTEPGQRIWLEALPAYAPDLNPDEQSAFAGNGGLAVGNVVGSNILNVLLILGAAAIAPLSVAQKLICLNVPLIIGVSVLV